MATRNILITGAARGIGRATAELFLARGWRVGMYDVDGDAVTEAANGRPGTVAGHLDVRDEQQWRSVLGEFCGDGGLDVLVNNAGVLTSGPFAAMAAGAHQRMVEINVLGTLYGALAGHGHLRRAERGMLINLCSASALYGQPALATYGATKSAVKSLTEALELEWRRDGIRVRSLVPLFVSTDMGTRDVRGAASAEKLGVRLAPEQVASTAWRVVHERDWPLRAPHRIVGAQTRLLSAATGVSPNWVGRLAVKRMSG